MSNRNYENLSISWSGTGHENVSIYSTCGSQKDVKLSSINESCILTCENSVGEIEQVNVGSERAGKEADSTDERTDDCHQSPAEFLDQRPRHDTCKIEMGSELLRVPSNQRRGATLCPFLVC